MTEVEKKEEKKHFVEIGKIISEIYSLMKGNVVSPETVARELRNALSRIKNSKPTTQEAKNIYRM